MILLTVTSTLIKTLLTLIMLLAVLFMLLGMNRIMSRGFADGEQMRRLREDVKHRDDVITEASVFREFLARHDSRHSSEKVTSRE